MELKIFFFGGGKIGKWKPGGEKKKIGAGGNLKKKKKKIKLN